MKFTFTLFIAFLLIGCATSYQAEGFTGGFSETQLDRNVFKVTFKGNGRTRSERAEDFVLLRSAELTLKHGFSHFAIIDERQTTDQVVITTPTEYQTTGSANSYGNFANFSATTTTSGGNSYVIKRPSASNTIVCFNGKPNNGLFVYDAQFIYNGLTSKYKINSN